MSLTRWLLAPLAPLYGLAVRLRNRAFDQHPERTAAVPVPVVSVGNLTTGGTGKTPVALYLARPWSGPAGAPPSCPGATADTGPWTPWPWSRVLPIRPRPVMNL